MSNADPPRKTRKSFEVPFQAHAFTFSTCGKRQVLLRPGVPMLILDALDNARDKFRFEVNAFVIMPDHVHTMIRPLDAIYKIGPILQAIKGLSSKRIFEHDPVLREQMPVIPSPKGPVRRLWEAGGGCDQNVKDSKMAWTWIRYVHLNPVRKQLCEFEKDWLWSSARAYEGGEAPIRVDLATWAE